MIELNRPKLLKMYTNYIKIWDGVMILQIKINITNLLDIKKNVRHEKIFRNDNIYDLLIPIHYNTKKIIKKKVVQFLSI